MKSKVICSKSVVHPRSCKVRNLTVEQALIKVKFENILLEGMAFILDDSNG